MATFVSLINWTEQGAKDVKDTPNRARRVQQEFQRRGLDIQLYWTQGEYDLVAIVTGNDEQAIQAAMLWTGTIGSVRTKTLRAFNASEIEAIIQQV